MRNVEGYCGEYGEGGGGSVARFVTVHRKLANLTLLHTQKDKKLNAIVLLGDYLCFICVI